MDDLTTYLKEDLHLWALLKAALVPFELTLIAMPLAVLFGIFLAVLRRSGNGWVSWPAAIYIEVVRGTPLLVQIFLAYYALPLLGQHLFGKTTTYFNFNPWFCAIGCLAANYAAYESEVFRAGLDAVDKGQREAALSIGMSERQAFFTVILPQAFRIVVPPVINDAVSMLKDTSLVSAIGVSELLNTAGDYGKINGNLGEMYVAASALYMLMSLACYFLGKWIEKKMKVAGAPELVPAGAAGAHH